MSFDPRSRRFDSRWLSPAIELDGEGPPVEPDTSPSSRDDVWTNGPAGQEFDEALEQIALDGCCVCPLCGAIVASDGSVMT